MRTHFTKLTAVLALALALPTAAMAQAWPQRPIKMIVPFPAGGGTDFIARIAAKHLSDRLGQQGFVENRGGGHRGLRLSAPDPVHPGRFNHPDCSRTPPVGHSSPFSKLAFA